MYAVQADAKCTRTSVVPLTFSGTIHLQSKGRCDAVMLTWHTQTLYPKIYRLPTGRQRPAIKIKASDAHKVIHC